MRWSRVTLAFRGNRSSHTCSPYQNEPTMSSDWTSHLVQPAKLDCEGNKDPVRWHLRRERVCYNLRRASRRAARQADSRNSSPGRVDTPQATQTVSTAPAADSTQTTVDFGALKMRRGERQ